MDDSEIIDLANFPPGPVGPRRASQDPPLRVPAVATGDPELDPLVSYLKDKYEREIQGGSRLVIDDATYVRDFHFNETYQDLVDDLLGKSSEQLPTEVMHDFCEKNRASRPVWPEMTRHLPASLLSSEEKNTFFSGGGDGWGRFHAKYPAALGIITVSRVGLSRDKSLAFFSVYEVRNPLNALGRFHVFKKEGDSWVEVPIESLPVIMS